MASSTETFRDMSQDGHDITGSDAIMPSGGWGIRGWLSAMFNKPPFLYEVAMGNVPGYSSVNKFGHNPSITAATDPEDVWQLGGTYSFFPTSAQAMEVLSSSGEDTLTTGTGAWTILVYGKDGDYNEISEVVEMDGGNIVALTKTYIRMHRVIVMTAGSIMANVGNITIRIASAGAVGAYIGAGDSQTQQAIYTIPANKTGMFVKGYVGISKGGGATVYAAEFKWKMRLANGGAGAWQTKGQIECITHGSSWWQYKYGVPVGMIPEKTDIKIECSEVTGTLGVVGGFDLLLKDD
ncbi:hypothetical protein KAR91_26100 [Candidatus Pacearchaeota archaeon]|nr:hypothetical protein [Candidatus Pacearchaeota archaeon]